jgi:hypothetical protein
MEWAHGHTPDIEIFNQTTNLISAYLSFYSTLYNLYVDGGLVLCLYSLA